MRKKHANDEKEVLHETEPALSEEGVEEGASLNGPREETPRDENTGGYRTTQRLDERKKLRKNVFIFTIVLAIVATLAVLMVIKWENVKDAAGWVGDKISSLWESDNTEQSNSEVFLTNPLTGQDFQGDGINTLVAMVDDNNVIHALFYVGWNKDGTIKFYWIPENLVGKTQNGNDMRLSQALAEHPDRPSELRYMIESLTGEPVQYVAVIPLRKFLLLAGDLDLPSVKVSSDTEVFNPFTSVREKLLAGQELKDMDRVLAYLLDEVAANGHSERERRGIPYLQEVLENLSSWTQADLSAALLEEPGAFTLSPSASGEEERAAYLASLISAWSENLKAGGIYLSIPEISILNGCGVVGAGNALKGQLEARGFQVAEAGGNAKVVIDGQEYNDFSHQTSVIYYNSQDPLAQAQASYIAVLFSIPKVEFKEGGTGITIIVGKDLAAPAI
jgi:anionic cell wall polymer biosynthesis LytR-Cps2A-Psr (LCP) family protein